MKKHGMFFYLLKPSVVFLKFSSLKSVKFLLGIFVVVLTIVNRSFLPVCFLSGHYAFLSVYMKGIDFCTFI